MVNCQYGCEEVKGEVQCLCPSGGLQLGPNGRTCIGMVRELSLSFFSIRKLICLDLAQQGEVQRFSRRAAAALRFLFLGLSLKLFSDISFLWEIMEFLEFLLTLLHDFRANNCPQWTAFPEPVTPAFTMPGLKVFCKLFHILLLRSYEHMQKPSLSVKL